MVGYIDTDNPPDITAKTSMTTGYEQPLVFSTDFPFSNNNNIQKETSANNFLPRVIFKLLESLKNIFF